MSACNLNPKCPYLEESSNEINSIFIKVNKAGHQSVSFVIASLHIVRGSFLNGVPSVFYENTAISHLCFQALVFHLVGPFS